jgi:hypothetical protein
VVSSAMSRSGVVSVLRKSSSSEIIAGLGYTPAKRS